MISYDFHTAKYCHAPTPAVSASAVSVIPGLLWPEKKNWKLREIKGSQVSKDVPRQATTW
jgi:hypothetical protein